MRQQPLSLDLRFHPDPTNRLFFHRPHHNDAISNTLLPFFFSLKLPLTRVVISDHTRRNNNSKQHYYYYDRQLSGKKGSTIGKKGDNKDYAEDCTDDFTVLSGSCILSHRHRRVWLVADMFWNRTVTSFVVQIFLESKSLLMISSLTVNTMK